MADIVFASSQRMFATVKDKWKCFTFSLLITTANPPFLLKKKSPAWFPHFNSKEILSNKRVHLSSFVIYQQTRVKILKVTKGGQDRANLQDTWQRDEQSAPCRRTPPSIAVNCRRRSATCRVAEFQSSTTSVPPSPRLCQPSLRIKSLSVTPSTSSSATLRCNKSVSQCAQRRTVTLPSHRLSLGSSPCTCLSLRWQCSCWVSAASRVMMVAPC